MGATEKIEAQLFNYDLPLDGQDMSEYGPNRMQEKARAQIITVAWNYAPQDLDPVSVDVQGDQPKELKRELWLKALRRQFPSEEAGLKMIAASTDLNLNFVREMLAFVNEAPVAER